MISDTTMREARFDIYCNSCKYRDLPGFEDPCDECLNTPGVEDTRRPFHHKKDGSYINYLEPDGKTYTRDYLHSRFKHKPTDEELKLYFEKQSDGDWYEKSI